MDADMDIEIEMVALVHKLEEAGYCFAEVSDEDIRSAFLNKQDLRDLAVIRFARTTAN
ncbi:MULTISPECIES: hypothetical protein [Acidithiobacillus]|jgi:hypothetical protein|uniref:Uncharacterized protein n=2 Tax=Acidithiobacillus ferridurans TaxID=1232575 RepID=A0A8X8KBU2_ACIFI|nr:MULTISPECIES: hypothetical protein [Acidithiobacillus]MBU2714555.1 hypothetical protein [Acidithiobacillus ferridurans]MBU2723587.1 hypothetical protein [Acidithiobacillus ferridurans]MBU2725823.1 hypothetical protein [Acidithiobacillus ferridurans]BBF66775.1 hypothetical protein AFERRID_29930 [Acidithiobacillus ferridurans]